MDGDRTTGVTNTSVRGRPLGAKTEFNDFDQDSLTYFTTICSAARFSVNAYRAEQAMRYVAEDGTDRQDPLIAPLGTLIDQSEIHTEKKGLRTGWGRPNVFNVSGLDLNAGIDWTEDVGRTTPRAHRPRLGAADEIHESGAVRAALFMTSAR